MEDLPYPWFSEPEMMNQSSAILHSVNNSRIFTDDFTGPTIHEFLGDDFFNIFDPFSVENSTNTPFCTNPKPFIDQVILEPSLIHSGTKPKQKRVSTEGAHGTVPIMLNFGEAIASENTDNVNSVWETSYNVQKETINHKKVKNVTHVVNKNSRVGPQSQTYDHVISERKRRKVLSEQFITLSGMVPGLEKTDKTSVLGATIEHMRNMQERVEMLEEKLAKQTVESAVLVRKSHIMVDQVDKGSSDENGGCNSNYRPLPEIEAKVCKNQALLKIHCEKQQNVMVKILNEVDKLNLTVLHSNVLSFGNLILDITIIVEMINKEHACMANQIVQALHSALMKAF